MFGDIIQPTHLLFILVVALLVLGPKRLPEVGRSLGRGIRDFRQGMQGVEAEARDMFGSALHEPEAPAGQAVHEAVAEPVGVSATASNVAPSATHLATEPHPDDYAD